MTTHDHRWGTVVMEHQPEVESEIEQGSMSLDDVMLDVNRHDVEVFDMKSYFVHHSIDSVSADQYYLPDDRHNNNKGYAIFAKGMDGLF